MKEHDSRIKAKINAEFITPEELRKFLASKVDGENLSILEPAIGSGQLLFNIDNRIAYIDGFDVNKNSLAVAKDNFKHKINTYNQDFIVADITKEYDVAIANYPFSLKPCETHKDYISNDPFLSQFYTKQKKTNTGLFGADCISVKHNVKPEDIKGRLDYIFILKSFQHARQGFYLCFAGIAYRQEEEKFRKYLIDNKLIKEYGILHNCKFEHTAISIIYLHLTKEPCQNPKAFYQDFKTGEYIQEDANFENNQFNYPSPAKEVVKHDPVALELLARKALLQDIKKSLEFSNAIYKLDPELQKSLPTIEEYKEELIDFIKNFECKS